jgi:hypothetical protein
MTCEANSQKLSALRRGVSYDEASDTMGCPGWTVPEHGPATGSYETVEWNGPGSALFRRTRLNFLQGKLLSYTTENRGAL